MARRYDRRQRELAAGLEILKGSVKQKPRWMPAFVWMRILRLVFK
jgi:hypothetical protein